MKVNGQITFLIDEYGAKIEIRDKDSSCVIVKVVLNSLQLCQMLGRLAHTECRNTEICDDFHKLGNKMIVDKLIFEVPREYIHSQNEDKLIEMTTKRCPDGWECDFNFNSQNSFIYEDGKVYANLIIRNWSGKTFTKKRNKLF